jgi:hypothetical protein
MPIPEFFSDGRAAFQHSHARMSARMARQGGCANVRCGAAALRAG